MSIKIAAVAAVLLIATASGLACDVNGATPSKLQPALLNINQDFNGQVQPFVWVMDLCQGTQLNPSSDAGACENTNPAFVKEYSPKTATASEQCLHVWDKAAGFSGKGMWVGEYTSTTSKWTATVYGECNGDALMTSKGNAMVTGSFDTGFHFTFTMASKHFCVNAEPAKKSGGSPAAVAFVIIFFVGGFLYVVCFSAFNYFKLGKRGVEVLPHREFWTATFPGLIKDGLIFTKDTIMGLVNRIRGGGGSSSSGESSYAQV